MRGQRRDTVNLRMVARSLPGKQFEVGRRLRTLVAAALRHAGIASPAGASAADVSAGDGSSDGSGDEAPAGAATRADGEDENPTDDAITQTPVAAGGGRP